MSSMLKQSMDEDAWKNLPIELLKVIAQSLEFVDDLRSFSRVCKSWELAAFELEPWMHSKFPCLLLAEDPGFDFSEAKVSKHDAMLSEIDNRQTPLYPSRWPEEDALICGIYELFRNPSSIRGWFSFATEQIYKLDLPEAMDKVLLGTNHGWLLTFGRDFEANLLHPLSRQQIPLPPMLTKLPNKSYADFQQLRAKFITRVVISSEIPKVSVLQDHHRLPMIMASYTEHGFLVSARPGDKSWTDVELETLAYGFEDIVYHKETFYAVDFCGSIFMCYTDNKQYKGKIITSVPVEQENNVQAYLVESLSGSHLWLVLRFREGEIYKEEGPYTYGRPFYSTVNCKVFKLEIHHSCSILVLMVFRHVFGHRMCKNWETRPYSLEDLLLYL